jgi:hypothetical protein
MLFDYLRRLRSCRNATSMVDVDRSVGKTLLRFAWLCVIAASLPYHLWAEDARGSLMPLHEVKKGMTGYGLTVFDGRDIEKFDVEILGVLENIGPDHSLILAKVDSDLLRVSGVIAGMSGSPIYIGDRLIGALAYSWMFARSPVAGITPIEQMLGIERHARGSVTGSVVQATAGEVFDALASHDLQALRVIFDQILPPMRIASGGASPISIPLSMSQFDPGTLAKFGPWLEAANFLPVPMGSTSASGTANAMTRTALAPGDAVAAVLVDGAFSLAATGTVTHVNGDEIYAFGHPFLHMGSIDFPMAGADVVTVMPSLASSFKLSNMGEIVGALTQDRLPGVYGKLGQEARTVPLRFSLESAAGLRDYDLRVVDHPSLFPLILAMVADSIVANAQRGGGERTVMMEAAIHLEGREPIRISEGFTGTNARQAIPLYLAVVSGYLISNEFSDMKLDKVEIRLRHDDEPRVAKLVDARVETPENGRIRPGDTIRVRAQLKPFRGEAFYHTIEVPLPESLQPGPLYLFVGSGSALTRLEFTLVPPSPRSVSQVVNVVERLRPSTELRVSVYAPSEGAVVGGVYLPELPPTMHLVTIEEKGAIGGSPVKYHPVSHQAHSFDQVISGAHRIDLKVDPLF